MKNETFHETEARLITEPPKVDHSAGWLHEGGASKMVADGAARGRLRDANVIQSALEAF